MKILVDRWLTIGGSGRDSTEVGMVDRWLTTSENERTDNE